MDHRRAHLLLGLVIVFWAGNYPLGKLALQELGPITLTGARTLLAAPLLVLVARLTAPLPRPLGRADHAAPGASRTVTLLNLMPFAVLGLSWALVGETIHAYHVAGAALVVTGVYLATRPT